MQDTKHKGRPLKTGHYAGLKFRDGWFFTHVLETEYIELKPWVLMNEDNERDTIAPHTAGSEDDEILDHVDRNLVTPKEAEQNLMYQLYIGVAPSRMQIYPFFGRNRAPNLTGGAEPGTPQVPLTGFDSPYNNPTHQGEVFTVNNIDDLALQAYNPMDEEKEARISFHVNKIKYAAVDDVGMMRAFLEGQVPFRDHSMGLSVQSNEQLRAPGWLDDRFGDVIMSTSDILQAGSDDVTGTSGNGGVRDRIPSQNGGGE